MDNKYIIFTDSACDVSPEKLQEWGVKFVKLGFTFTSSGDYYEDNDIPSPEFYKRMREGDIAKTSAVNFETFRDAFDKEAAAGNDILYIGFSSGLSGTYNSGRLAAMEVAGKYPERKILTVDSLCASTGEGLMVYLSVLKKNEGYTIDQLAQYVNDTKLHICHWFTVDDLVYLKRGGRVSPTVAFVGNALGIKPVMHTDNEGKLVPVSKVRGRRKAIEAIAEKYGELAVDKTGGHVFICHGDCIEDAELLKDMVSQKYGATVELIEYTGAVIGSHSGPGTLALFFVGKER